MFDNLFKSVGNSAQNIFGSLFKKKTDPYSPGTQMMSPYVPKSTPTAPMSYSGQSIQQKAAQASTPGVTNQPDAQNIFRPSAPNPQATAEQIKRDGLYSQAQQMFSNSASSSIDQRQQADKQRMVDLDMANVLAEKRKQAYEAGRAPIMSRYSEIERTSADDISNEQKNAEAQKAATAERYNQYLRETAQARQQGMAQNNRAYALNNAIDSYGVGSLQQANQNVESDMERKRQLAFQDRETKYAQIDSDFSKYKRDAQLRLANEKSNRDQALIMIDQNISMSDDEKLKALRDIQGQFQQRVTAIQQEERATREKILNLVNQADQEYAQKLAEKRDSMPSQGFINTQVPQTPNDYQLMLKNPQGAKTIAELLKNSSSGDKSTKNQQKQEMLDLIQQLINSDTKPMTGALQIGPMIPGSAIQPQVNAYNQLMSKLSLDGRQALKGSGAISDFEAKMLQDASSRLNRNLSDDDFKNELKNLYRSLTKDQMTTSGMSDPLGLGF